MTLRLLIFCAVVALTASPVTSHHSFAMFDLTKNVTYAGKVVEYRWQNPHVHIVVKVPNDAKDPSSVGTWDLEGASVNIMARQGWSKITFNPGDSITAVAHPMKEAARGHLFSMLSVQTALACTWI